MLAGERFSDRPECVDPVLATFLRAFNDRLGHGERQRLVPYAARAVGTRAGRAAERRRSTLCIAYGATVVGARTRLGARLRVALLVGVLPALRLRAGAAEFAARCAIASGDVEGGFALLDRLIGVGGAPVVPVVPEPERKPLVRAAL